MKINKRLIKRDEIVKKTESTFRKIDGITISPTDPIESFSIVITFSHNKVDSLHDCFYYLNKCHGIDKCEVILVLYENEYIEYDFSKYENIDYKIIHSKRNNDKNIFCLSHARNIGLVRAKYDWVLMLDCDILLPEDTCRYLSHPKVRNPNKIYFTHRVNIKSHENYKDLDYLYERKSHMDKIFLGFFQFFNRKKAIELVGGYDIEMSGWGQEDIDFLTRMHRSGIKPDSISSYMKAFHVMHGYEADWKYEGSDEHNFKQKIYNLKNNLIKKENIGIIIK